MEEAESGCDDADEDCSGIAFSRSIGKASAAVSLDITIGKTTFFIFPISGLVVGICLPLFRMCLSHPSPEFDSLRGT